MRASPPSRSSRRSSDDKQRGAISGDASVQYQRLGLMSFRVSSRHPTAPKPSHVRVREKVGLSEAWKVLHTTASPPIRQFRFQPFTTKPPCPLLSVPSAPPCALSASRASPLLPFAPPPFVLSTSRSLPGEAVRVSHDVFDEVIIAKRPVFVLPRPASELSIAQATEVHRFVLLREKEGGKRLDRMTRPALFGESFRSQINAN